MLTSSNSRNSRAALTCHSAFLVFLFCVSLLTGNDAVRAFGRLETSGPRQIPQPSQVLGFTPGDDRKLASWNQVVSYFRRLAETSNRVKLDEIGKSTMGAPFVYATISAPENLSHLKEIMGIQ